jgi:hypothetical protein
VKEALQERSRAGKKRLAARISQGALREWQGTRDNGWRENPDVPAEEEEEEEVLAKA